MAQDTLLGFPAHTLPFRRGEFTTLLTVCKLQQELCHILDQCLLNVTLYHVRFEGDKIEDIWIFHGLRCKFALW